MYISCIFKLYFGHKPREESFGSVPPSKTQTRLCLHVSVIRKHVSDGAPRCPRHSASNDQVEELCVNMRLQFILVLFCLRILSDQHLQRLFYMIKQEAQGLYALLDKMEDNDHINWITQTSRYIFYSTCRFRDTRFSENQKYTE